MVKVRDWFGSIGRFKGGLSSQEWVNSVIINVITEKITAVTTYRYLRNISTM